jgi:cytochrome c5
MKSKITILALAVMAVYSCKAKKEVTEYKPVETTAQRGEIIAENKPEVLSPVTHDPETVKLAATYDGKNLYSNSCGRCHKLYAPADYSKENWVPILKRMQKKARTTDAETLAIFDYLTSETK